ncbi:SH3 domain-containing protein [Streptomyces brasiliensis]|uniref:SH3 domain-containing protein n=1 Tax=Streptomyces brasiliensis TaxID=1954 RepID=A0A917UJC4_9ACTN|nr:SH3 domain-containing protein [Streptomyces brasiliensis]GGJ62233.1 hypothetical protein GCM10010121_086090 [Streptomyces brasiliensis]
MPLRHSIPGAAATAALLLAFCVTPAVAGGSRADGGTYYRGIVTAQGGIWLRDQPDRGSRIVGFAAEGDVISIYCKTYGEPALNNPLWYLLTDGTWAWGPARFIANFGESPRWC